MNRKNETVRSVVLGTVRRQPLLCTALVLAVAGAVAASLLPPLVLGRVVDRLTARQAVLRLFELGLVSRRGCEQRAICDEVERLELQGMARCEAFEAAAQKLCCSYEKVRGAFYNKTKN